MGWGQQAGQSWAELGYLGLAFLLSAVIGLEREVRQKSAGLRTHTVVGLAAALMMQVSKFGFADVLGEHVSFDPSRVAAQIVSGIGFIGGGLIFVRRDAVRGLTTAAAIWLTAGVGMAAGAGLPVLAVAVTAAHFVIVLGFAPLAARIPGSTRPPARLRVGYKDGRGVLRVILNRCTDLGYTVRELSTEETHPEEPGTVRVNLTVQGKTAAAALGAALSEIDGVLSVTATDPRFELGD